MWRGFESSLDLGRDVSACSDVLCDLRCFVRLSFGSFDYGSSCRWSTGFEEPSLSGAGFRLYDSSSESGSLDLFVYNTFFNVIDDVINGSFGSIGIPFYR